MFYWRWNWQVVYPCIACREPASLMFFFGWIWSECDESQRCWPWAARQSARSSLRSLELHTGIPQNEVPFLYSSAFRNPQQSPNFKSKLLCLPTQTWAGVQVPQHGDFAVSLFVWIRFHLDIYIANRITTLTFKIIAYGCFSDDNLQGKRLPFVEWATHHCSVYPEGTHICCI